MFYVGSSLEEKKLRQRMEILEKKAERSRITEVNREQEMMAAKFTKGDVDEIMQKLVISDTDKAMRMLRKMGGSVSDAIRAFIFDFPELSVSPSS